MHKVRPVYTKRESQGIRLRLLRLGLGELRHVVEGIEERARRPSLGAARVVAVAAVLVRELGEAGPWVGRDVSAVPRKVLVDVVERRREVVLAGADERVEDEVRAQEVA